MKWAAMLRGINLGNRQMKKDELIACAKAAGFSNATTLLASGNIVFEAGDASGEAIEKALYAAVETVGGLKSEVFARNRRDLEQVIAANPFPDTARDRPSQLLVLFHAEQVPAAPLDAIAQGYDGPERLAAVGRELFIDYPEGMGRSKLDPAMARLKIKLPRGTGRNWNTVRKLFALLDD